MVGVELVMPENITIGLSDEFENFSLQMESILEKNRPMCNFNITPDIYNHIRNEYNSHNLNLGNRIVETFCKKPTTIGKLHLVNTRELFYLELNEPFEMYGWTFEVIGGGYEPENTVIIDINGNRKTLKEGESLTNGNVTIYAESLFLTSIPYLTASGNFRISFMNKEVKDE